MKRITRVLIAALLATVFVVPASTSAVERQVALGVSMADDKNLDAVDAFTASAGRAPAIWAVWGSWGNDPDFPTATLEGLRGRGIVPMINWTPVGPNQNDCSKWSLDNIIRGDYDAYVRDWATEARDFGGRIILRFAFEMNRYWYIWGDGRCTNTPAKFREAWTHVWNIFRGPNGVGATNVKFLWSILGPQKAGQYYPGAAYVDYTGFSAFNWGPGNRTYSRPWRSMVKNFKSVVRRLNRFQKPIIGAEMGASYDPTCAVCGKPTYIAQGYPAVYAKWPRIVALVYFNLDMGWAAQPDWRLESPPATMDAYRSIVADPRFQGTIP